MKGPFFCMYFKLKQELLAAEESDEFDYSNLREAKSHIATKRSFDEIFGLFASFTPNWHDLKSYIKFQQNGFQTFNSPFFLCLL